MPYIKTYKDTYDYCEYLINEKLNSLIGKANLCIESPQGEGLPSFKQELKDLYNHLENIQGMKESYLSRR